VSAAIAFTALLGLVNGFVISKARIQPFIATLAMMIAARGLALVYTGEQSVRAETATGSFSWLGRGAIGFVPVPVFILIIAYIVAALVLNHTRFGRHVYAVGDNEEAARLMGLNVNRVTIGVYTLSGALAGLAGVILATRHRTTGCGCRLGTGCDRGCGGRRHVVDGRPGRRRIYSGWSFAVRCHLQSVQSRREDQSVVATCVERSYSFSGSDYSESPEREKIVYACSIRFH
jgi:hypothetical protein